jgi:ferredoxin-NADP reductase
VHAFVTPTQHHNAPTAFAPPKSKQQQQQPQYYAPVVRQNNRCVLYMGWGPDPVWSSAAIKTNEFANQSGKSVSITVSVPPETAAGYKVPGQYVQFRLNEECKPLFLAVASPPDAENAVFEFLIKKTDDNGWMTDAAAGAKMEVSQVLGGGFPMEENLEGIVKYDFPCQNVLLFGAGSGIAPIKAAMESGE